MNLYNINELKDSRIFFDKKPPNFMIYFCWSILAILVVTLITLSFLTKPYIVKAQGKIQYSDLVYVSSLANGEISKINFHEGELVKTGDVIIQLNSKIDGIQYESINEQIDALNKKIEVYDLYQKSLDTKKNLLTKNESQLEYYGKVEYYLGQLETEQQDNSKLTKTIADKKESLKKLIIQLDSIGSEEQFKTEKESKLAEIKTLEQEITDSENRLNTTAPQSLSAYNQMLSELGAARNTSNEKLKELEGQRSQAISNDEQMNLVANGNGRIHYINPIFIGNAIQAGTPLVEIQGDENSTKIVSAFVSATDRSKINIEDEVKVAVTGTNEYKFGTLTGKISSIDNGVITQETENGNQIYYKVNLQLNNDKLESKDGDTVYLENSMPVEARIIYKKETYMEWILEKLDLRIGT